MNQTCDFAFGLWDNLMGGTQIGVTQTATATVTLGYFTVPNVDFGTGAFNGQARWLAVAVRCPSGSGSFTSLSPRQPLRPAPYALALPGLWTQQNGTSPNLIGGFHGNSVTSNVAGATIGGGGSAGTCLAGVPCANRVTDSYGTVGGGEGNRAGDGAGSTSDRAYATVGGGDRNIASGLGATVGGGKVNSASGDSATVGGGGGNTASGNYATVGGGDNNKAEGYAATVSGGRVNSASGSFATVGGGIENVAAGDYSFVVGNRAKNDNSAHDGVFIFADSKNFDFPSTAANQFRVRATGGAQFVSGIDGSGNPNAGVTLASGSGSWSSISDRALKDNFVPVNPRQILKQVVALPIHTWNYKTQSPAIRHIGPTAQDFYAAFGVGEDNRHITAVDADGVALAAIQGLYQVVQDKDAQITRLQTKVTTLEAQNTKLKARVDQLEARLAALERGSSARSAALSPDALVLGSVVLGTVGSLWLALKRKGALR